MNARQAKKRAQKGEPSKNDLRRQLLSTEQSLQQVEKREQTMSKEYYRAAREAVDWRARALAAEKLLDREADDVMSYARQPFSGYPSIHDMEMVAKTLQIEGKVHVGVSIDFGRVFRHDFGQNTEAIKANLVRRFTQMAQEHAQRVFRVIRG